jgi:hypothetical protein
VVVVVWVVVLVLAAFSFLTASLPSWRATALYRDTPFACEGTPDSPGLYVDGTGGAFSLDSYLPCTAQDLMPKDSDKYNFLVNSILPSAIDYLESTLSVLPVTSPMSWASEAWADSYCLKRTDGHLQRRLRAVRDEATDAGGSARVGTCRRRRRLVA